MKGPADLPTDALGTLGAPIKHTPAPVDTVRPFERGNFGPDGKLIADQSKALESIADSLRKKVFADWRYGAPVVRDEQTED